MPDGLQPARQEDLDGIAFVKKQTWPEEPVRRDLISHVITAEDHCIQIIRYYRKIAGFVDGFMTMDDEGNRRWEIDLLAVHPSQRGRGFGEQLVKACMQEGRSRKAAWARALIGIGNYASQVTFSRCGFVREDSRCSLFVSSGRQSQDEPPVQGAHLLPVTTINYRGLWIENHFESSVLAYARVICHREGMDLAGAVIPTADEVSVLSAQDAGYDLVGYYEWWNYPYFE
jgi:ribosomal protein S18 acetylase RimI-like enzyme